MSCVRPRKVARCIPSTSGPTGSLRRQWFLRPVALPLVTARQGRASVPRSQAPVRVREGPQPRAGQAPRPALHAVRARQPVPGPTEADGMRTSLSQICQAAQRRARNNKISCKKTRFVVAKQIRRYLGADERVDQTFLKSNFQI